MRITNNEVFTIASAMQARDTKIDHETKKALRNDPKLKKKAKELLAKFNSIPKELRSELRLSYSTKITAQSIEDLLFGKLEKNSVALSQSAYEQQVRLAALEAKDMAELKKKLNITF